LNQDDEDADIDEEEDLQTGAHYRKSMLDNNPDLISEDMFSMQSQENMGGSRMHVSSNTHSEVRPSSWSADDFDRF
jgi:hypothetical protein